MLWTLRFSERRRGSWGFRENKRRERTMSFVVAVTDYVFPSLEPEQRVLAPPLGVELRPAQCKSEEEIIDLTREADAVLNCYAKMTARVIENPHRCKVIARYGIGVDNVDIVAA